MDQVGKSEKRATSQSETSEIFANGSHEQRSSERQALAEAIRVRDEAAEDAATFVRARERAASDRFKAARAVEAAEAALNTAREAARASLVGAYIDDEIFDDSAVTKSEAELRLAQRRLNDLQTVADGLAAHRQAPGRSVPATNVAAAVRNVVKAHPAVRRLASDFAIAKRAYLIYHSTLRSLNARGMIPEDLREVIPSATETFYADPDPAWTDALEALLTNPDAKLPDWDEMEPNPYARLQ